MKFLYLFSSKIQYYQGSRDGRCFPTFSTNPWLELRNLLNYKCAAYLALAATRYVWPLLFIYHLTAIVTPGSSVDVQPFNTLILALFALGGCAGAVFTVRLDQKISLELCNKYQRLLTRKTNCDLGRLERVSSRDLSVVLDGIGETVNLLAIPLFLILSTYLLLSNYGIKGFYCSVIIFVFLPISFFLSKIAGKNYDAVVDLASSRIELGSSWIRNGPLLKQFGITMEFAELAAKAKVELQKRNIDTALRGADSYIVGFGRLVPYAFLSIMGGSAYKMDWDGSVFWLAMPLLSAVLDLPRAFLNYKNVKRSLSELACAYAGSSPIQPGDQAFCSLTTEPFDFDPNWPIWPSKLAGLLPDSETADVAHTSDLLKSLRLVPEFGPSCATATSKLIGIDGNNISEGQRLRVQLLRGYFAARKLRRKMLVDNHLACLDAQVAKSAMRVLVDSGFVEFTQEAQKAINRRRQHTAEYVQHTFASAGIESNGSMSGTSVFSEKAFLVGVCLLFLPAVMMGYSANITLEHFSQYELFSYILTGVVLGVLGGLYIESRTRANFSQLIFNGLKNIQEGDAANAIQVVSRDTDVAYERLAWYSHDIAWITALLLFNVFALSSSLGVRGFLLACMFSLSLYALYRVSIQELYTTRVASIRGFDALINATQTAYVISKAYSSIIGKATKGLREIQAASASSGVADFFLTRTRAQVAKSMTAILCVAISDFSIVMVVFLCMALEVASADFLFVVTALLLVRSDLANVFLAITGYKSQSISKGRIVRFSEEPDAVSVTSDGTLVAVSPFTGLRSYRSLKLKAGSVNVLVSPSGGGKTQYMKSVAGVARSTSQEPCSSETGKERIRCYYLNRATLEHLCGDEWSNDVCSLVSSIRSIDFSEQALVFFDEITSDLSVQNAYAVLDSLQEFVRSKNLTLLIVDHRLELGRAIFLDDITVKFPSHQSSARDRAAALPDTQLQHQPL